MNALAQFLGYVFKVFALGKQLRGVRDSRPYPEIPTRAVVLSLLLGAVLRMGSYLDLAAQTKRRIGPRPSATMSSPMSPSA